MKVKNMTSKNGRQVPNQFIIYGQLQSIGAEDGQQVEIFQSDKTTIAKKVYYPKTKVYLDKNYWKCSTITSKYRNQFLGETTKETQKKIDSGEYVLADLN